MGSRYGPSNKEKEEKEMMVSTGAELIVRLEKNGEEIKIQVLSQKGVGIEYYEVCEKGKEKIRVENKEEAVEMGDKRVDERMREGWNFVHEIRNDE